MISMRQLCNEIRERTESGELQWRQAKRTQHAELIMNISDVIRQFETPFSRAGNTYKLLCLERQTWDDSGFFVSRKEISYEFLILEHDELALRLDGHSTDPLRLLFLGSDVVAACDATKRLLAETAN